MTGNITSKAYARDRGAIRFGRVKKRYIVLLVILIPSVGVAWLAYRTINAHPGPLVDYGSQLIALTAASQPDGENGWPVLLGAIEKFESAGEPNAADWPADPSATEAIRSLTAVTQGEFDRQRIHLELLYLEHFAESNVLEGLDAMSRCERFVRDQLDVDPEGGLMLLALPELAQVRDIARMRRAAMRVAAQAGDNAELIRASTHLLALARATSHDVSMISHLVGVACAGQMCEETCMLAVELDLDEDTSLALLTAIDTQLILAPLSVAFEHERLLQYDTIQRTHTDDGRGDGMLIVSRINDTGGGVAGALHSVFQNFQGYLQASRAETTEMVDQYIDALIERSQLPPTERGALSSWITGFENQLRPDQHMYLCRMLPASSRAQFNDDHIRTVINATRLLLAIEFFEARHGRLPDSIEDAAAGVLGEPPVDSITGQPYRFMRREPTEDDPRTFLLYSIGGDGEDNGGLEPPPGAFGRRANALQDSSGSAGYDYVFNRLREPVEER